MDFDPPDGLFAGALAKLSEADQERVYQDIAFYGTAMIEASPDGSVRVLNYADVRIADATSIDLKKEAS